MIVRVYAYKQYLIISGDTEVSHKDWVPWGGSRFGCVLMNTKEHLGISEEALTLLRQIAPGTDALVDVDWFESDERGWCFGWIGAPRTLINTRTAVSSKNHKVPSEEQYTIIPNEPPAEAVHSCQQYLREHDKK